MKMNDLLKKSLADSMSEMDLVDFKVHSDDKGNIKAIEVKYRPTDAADIQVPQFLTK